MPTTNGRGVYAAQPARGPSIWLVVGAVIGIAALVTGAVIFLSKTPTLAPSANGSSASPGPIVSRSTASPHPSPSPRPSPQTQAACVSSTLSKLTLDEQVGQLVLIGTPVDTAASVAATVRTYHLGGVFLAGRSTKSAASLRSAINTLQSAASANGGLRLQVALDQEGGEVQTLKGPDFPIFPDAVTQGGWSAATLRTQTTAWVKRLAAIGITLDLAPVADTVPAGTAKENPPVGAFNRQFGSDPAKVAADVSTVVSAAQSAGVLTTLKHFPGLGRVRVNTDTGTGAIDSVATTSDPYFAPFASGIKAGSAAVMISLASYPKLDSHSIAAFSAPIITGLLRGKLRFTGLIISDDLGSAAAVKSVPIGERAVRFITAGGDLALSVRSADAKPIVAALLAEAKASPAFATKVKAAATAVLRSKARAGLLSCAPLS